VDMDDADPKLKISRQGRIGADKIFGYYFDDLKVNLGEEKDDDWSD